MPTPSSFLTLRLEVKSGITRLDQALLEQLRQVAPGISRNQLKRLFEEKKIRLEGVSRPASWSLLPGSYDVVIEGLEEGVSSPVARASTRGSFLSIVYEDSDLLILNKNSGTPSVPHAFDETETAVGSALSHLSSLAGVGRGGLEPGLLHRLDTGTSGLLAFAKTNEVFERLRLDWKNGNVRKLYRAWVHGDAETLRLPMPLELTLAHHPESQKRMIVIPEGVQRKYRGKPLQTQTTLLKCFSKLEARGGIFSDVEVEIQTGVMHQIRCTLAYLNLAVVGDPIYGKPSDMAQPRLLLHAWKLSIPSPSRPGYRIEIEAPLPTDFRPCLA